MKNRNKNSKKVTTKKILLPFKVKRVSGIQSLVGLMFQKPYPIFINTRWGIHTLFMKETIDVLILDDKNFVVRVKSNLRSWSFYFWNPRYSKVLELPNGTIKRLKIIEGMKVKYC